MNRLVRVAGESMAPTYRPADLLLVRPVGRAGPPVGRGAVVVVRHDGRRMLKRVAGVPGDVVELAAGRLFVGGVSVDGRPRIPAARTRTWSVPPGAYFVVGDNAAVSDDSRVWDPPFVAASDVVAVAGRRLYRRRTQRAAALTPAAPGAGARPGR